MGIHSQWRKKKAWFRLNWLQTGIKRSDDYHLCRLVIRILAIWVITIWNHTSQMVNDNMEIILSLREFIDFTSR